MGSNPTASANAKTLLNSRVFSLRQQWDSWHFALQMPRRALRAEPTFRGWRSVIRVNSLTPLLRSHGSLRILFVGGWVLFAPQIVKCYISEHKYINIFQVMPTTRVAIQEAQKGLERRLLVYGIFLHARWWLSFDGVQAVRNVVIRNLKQLVIINLGDKLHFLHSKCPLFLFIK